MAYEQENATRPVDLEGGEFLESETSLEDRLPERQFCVFRAGRERFCLSVLEVEEVVDWPIVTRVPLAPAIEGDTQLDDLRLGIAADEVIGTYSATEEALLDQAPVDVPHCRGMLRHDDRLALVVDLRRLTDVFPMPVI
jgi:chemotaxis signal transduction protein